MSDNNGQDGYYFDDYDPDETEHDGHHEDWVGPGHGVYLVATPSRTAAWLGCLESAPPWRLEAAPSAGLLPSRKRALARSFPSSMLLMSDPFEGCEHLAR